MGVRVALFGDLPSALAATAHFTVREKEDNGALVAGATVELQHRPASGSAPSSIGSTVTDEQGKAQLTVTLNESQQAGGEFRAVIAKDESSKTWSLWSFPSKRDWNLYLPRRKAMIGSTISPEPPDPEPNQIPPDESPTIPANKRPKDDASLGDLFGDLPGESVKVPFTVGEEVGFQMQIRSAMQHYKETHGRTPRSHGEFMSEIVKANNIELPDLPNAAFYVYQPQTGELMIQMPDGPPSTVSFPGGGVEAGARYVFQCKGIVTPVRWCPAGTFLMGTATGEPDHSDREMRKLVTLTVGFWMAETETTQQLWEKVTNTTVQELADNEYDHPGVSIEWMVENALSRCVGPEFPAYCVSQPDASEFCTELTALLRADGALPDDWEISLPTEAQWEYACRAGSTTRFFCGDDEGKLVEYAWCYENAGRLPHPVGTKKPNQWGLHDMLGNVSEWCQDQFLKTLPGGADPKCLHKVDDLGRQVYRGGHYDQYPSHFRSGERHWTRPTERQPTMGFRFVVSPSF